MEFTVDDRVRVFSSEIDDGSMSLFDESFSNNSPEFLKKITANKPIAYCDQRHSNQIKLIDIGGSAGECDGILSEIDLALMVRTADCVPLMIVNDGHIGTVHCGRKSIVGGIIENLKSHLVSPESAKAFLGPHIRVKNYEVKQDVVDQLEGTKWQQFIIRDSQKSYFDMTAAVIFALDEIGIKRENIVDCGIDTFGDQRFFSARRDPQDMIKTFITVIYKNGSK
jgi:hypothetical protein